VPSVDDGFGCFDILVAKNTNMKMLSADKVP